MQAVSNLFMAQGPACFNLRQTLLDFGNKPGIVIDQSLDRFYDKRCTIASLQQGKTGEFVFKFK
jgi:hypothetical protein